MRFAKTCECEHPLTISEEDYCSFCSRHVRLPDELPPDPKSRPESLAISMYENGAAMDAIMAETGLGEFAIWKVADPEKYKEKRAAKNQADSRRYRSDPVSRAQKLEANNKAHRAAKQARFDAAYPKYQALRENKQRPIEDQAPYIAAIHEMRREKLTWQQVGDVLGIARETAQTFVNPEYKAKLRAKHSAYNKRPERKKKRAVWMREQRAMQVTTKGRA
jgi:hypothetical protein